MGSNISWLTTVPATDMNFKNHLQYATKAIQFFMKLESGCSF